MEAGAGDGGGVGTAVVGIGDLVGLAPQDQRRDGDRAESVAQGRVGHGGACAVDAECGAVGGRGCLLGFGQCGEAGTEFSRVVVAQLGQSVDGQGEDVGDGMVLDLEPGAESVVLLLGTKFR